MLRKAKMVKIMGESRMAIDKNGIPTAVNSRGEKACAKAVWKIRVVFGDESGWQGLDKCERDCKGKVQVCRLYDL